VDSTVTTTASSLLEALTVAQRDAARRVAAVLAPEGFTVEQWRILRALGDGAGHAMGELATALRIPGPTLTRLVDGLVDASLVYRRQATDDRRRLGVHLARAGRARLERLDALVAAQEDALRAAPEWQALARLVDRPVGA
jgi:DNA-binding MarR family transcriptional regulator